MQTGSGPIKQIAHVVEDLDASIEHWLQFVGVGPWTIYRNTVMQGHCRGIATGAAPGSIGFATARTLAAWGTDVTVTTRTDPHRWCGLYARCCRQRRDRRRCTRSAVAVASHD